MKRYIFTCGGSGAKCFEALIHMSAAGLINDDVTIMHIDPDVDNENVNRAKQALKIYMGVHNQSGDGHKEVFKAKLSNPCTKDGKDYEVWHPVPIRDPKVPTFYNSLKDYLGDGELLNLYYSESMRKLGWDIGFCGMPSIGAAVVSGAFDWEKDPWNLIKDDINNYNDKISAFFIGSVFGGTGAAVIPTLVNKFAKEFGKKGIAMGGALLFPYFYFTASGDEKNKKTTYVESSNFYLSSKLHLDYYNEYIKEFDSFKRIYILGETYQKKLPYVKIGTPQENPPHHLEFVSGMAVKDFFSVSNFNTDDKHKYLSRKEKDITTWDDFPNGDEAEKRLLIFTSMACSFLGFWSHLFGDSDFKKTEYFNLLRDDKFETGIKLLKEYFESYLLWVMGMHVECDGKRESADYKGWLCNSQIDENVKLLNAVIIQEFLKNSVAKNTIKKLTSIKYGNSKPEIKTFYDYIWKSACKIEYEASSNSIGKILNLLYKSCDDFVNNNYI